MSSASPGLSMFPQTSGQDSYRLLNSCMAVVSTGRIFTLLASDDQPVANVFLQVEPFQSQPAYIGRQHRAGGSERDKPVQIIVFGLQAVEHRSVSGLDSRGEVLF